MTQLFQRWQTLKTEQPKLRTRDAAAALGVSEADLVDASVGEGVVRLAGPFEDIVRGLSGVGRVMALTRNEAAVHERKGRYEKVSFSPHFGLVLGPDIDLRLFMKQWASAYAVQVPSRGRVLESIQFFDGHGEAVHKVYLMNDERAAWDALIAAHTADDQTAGGLVTTPAPAPPAPNPELDVDTLLAEWGAMTDTHQFFGILKRSGATSGQAFAAAEGRFTRRLPTDVAAAVLHQAAEQGTPIMVFVGNRGCIQIHSGPVKAIKPMGPWINVMDPDFNLHLHQQRVASAWHVRKPTEDGDVNSVELLDADGQVLVRFFGARKPGVPELEGWRALAQGLEAMTEVARA